MSTPPPARPSSSDPVVLRRATIARLTRYGQRVGYGLLGAAVAVFAVGAVVGFTSVDIVIVVACIALASAVLAPAIVFGYAVKAAEREDRERGAGRSGPAQSR